MMSLLDVETAKYMESEREPRTGVEMATPGQSDLTQETALLEPTQPTSRTTSQQLLDLWGTPLIQQKKLRVHGETLSLSTQLTSDPTPSLGSRGRWSDDTMLSATVEGSQMTTSVLTGTEEFSDWARTSATQETTEKTQLPNAIVASVKRKLIPSRKKTVLLIRCAERVDRIFPEWLRSNFTQQGAYTPTDLNQPSKIPCRPGGPMDFHNDSPITELGRLSAQMLGRALLMRNVRPTAIFSSPALRCVQTAAAMLEMLKGDLEICVEPGLFECRNWYGRMPALLSLEQLAQLQLPVKLNYNPVISYQELADCSENLQTSYGRIGMVVSLLTKATGEKGVVLFAGHATTLDAGGRMLLGKAPAAPNADRLQHLGLHFPYCSLIAIKHEGNDRWSEAHQPLLPVQSFNFNNRVNSLFLNQ